MAENVLPGGFGGLVRYNEEYDSKLKFGPGTVIAMILGVVALVIGLKIIYGA